MEKHNLIIANLDEELPVFKGATLPEVLVIAKYSFYISFLVGLLIGFILISWMLIIVLFFSIFGTIALIWISSASLKSVKRGKPPGYFMQLIDIFMFKHFQKKTYFLLKKSRWFGNRGINQNV
ncbi:hypothetical protein CYQ88_08325 [Hydrogenovibrio sp. SC-1]|uniref:DUF3487 family protein n=1 Tax=Hydrogenovibrio sp. SC-1 TaxID=2065820 RepID=UPI000C7A077B|nr:DUF3487 family protein [Hydrogenovibrio sp. SC-1]PLA73960.1 hypothetical protein CYQ88_08325 [Hydrogenovibrio sp. SC-1]